jgi:hypothetical protein
MSRGERQEALTAFLALVGAIVVLSAAGALAVAFAPSDRIDQVLGALGFIAAAVTGLVGVMGTFRPRARDEKAPPATHYEPDEGEP